MEKMKGRISKWMATALALVLLMSSGVMAENVVPAPATGTVSETEVQELNETGVETSAAPEASADPEASAAPEANTVLEMNIAPEANTMSTPGDSSATEGCLHQNFVQASTGHWGSQYSDPDAEGHTISTYIVKGYVCQDCGYQWEDEMPEEPSVYREPHSFQNGTCSYCGYKNQCAHANQEIRESREELE